MKKITWREKMHPIIFIFGTICVLIGWGCAFLLAKLFDTIYFLIFSKEG